MIFTSNDEWNREIRIRINQGESGKGQYDHILLGTNARMTDLQAAIGRVQLKKLPSFLKRREEIFQYYKKSGLDLLDIDDELRGILEPVRYRAILKTKNPRKLVNSLESVGVQSIIPTEDWELLGQREFLSNALKFSHETISIPIYPSLTKEHLDIILSGLVIK